MLIMTCRATNFKSKRINFIQPREIYERLKMENIPIAQHVVQILEHVGHTSFTQYTYCDAFVHFCL